MEYKQKLETKDLILGKAKLDDVESIYNNYWKSEQTAKFMNWTVCKTLEEAKERIKMVIDFQKNHMAYFVYDKKTNQAIGMAAFVEIEPDVYEDGGVGLGENFVGCGYGKQILNCFIEYIFNDLKAKKIICSCNTNNTPSAKLQQSCGLKFSHSEMVTRKKDNLTYQSDVYVITREEYLRLNNKV